MSDMKKNLNLTEFQIHLYEGFKKGTISTKDPVAKSFVYELETALEIKKDLEDYDIKLSVASKSLLKKQFYEHLIEVEKETEYFKKNEDSFKIRI